jgi:hypothetical protein
MLAWTPSLIILAVSLWVFVSSMGWNSRAVCQNTVPIELEVSPLQSAVVSAWFVGRVMKSDGKFQWDSMTIDELFALGELMQDVLSKKTPRRSSSNVDCRNSISRQRCRPTKSRGPESASSDAKLIADGLLRDSF